LIDFFYGCDFLVFSSQHAKEIVDPARGPSRFDHAPSIRQKFQLDFFARF
jgi:hypothetical protein